MTNPKDIALALAITATIADAAKEHKDRLREQLAELFDDIGAESTSAELDGERIAKVAVVAPKSKPFVRDEQTFIRWVERNFKDETTRKVRESFQTALFARLVETESGTIIDKATGEVVEGIAFRQGSSYVSTRFEKTGREAILEALRNGSLALDLTATPQLETGTN